MNLILLPLIFLLIFNSIVKGDEGDVVELTDNDFSSKLAGFDVALVMFYAPWCTHCKSLKPEFNKAAKTLIKDEQPVYLARIDCTELGKTTCNQFSISGYPTLKIFKNGEFSQDYRGPREASGIVKYMRAQVGPAAKELTTVESFKKFINTNEVSIVGFFEKETDLKLTFLKYADKMREKLRFGFSTAQEVLNEVGEKNTIILYRPVNLHNKFEDNFIKFSGSSMDNLINFVADNMHGLCGHRTRENAQDFKNPVVIAYYGVDYVKNPKGTHYWRNRILKVASEFKDIKFAIASKDDFQHELNEHGYDFVGDKPVILARDGKNLKYSMKDAFSIENLKTFVEKLLNNELEPYIKSEPVPESNDGPVKVVVAKTYKELVMDNDKDVFIELYAPWCGHCKKLQPVFDELGEKLKDEDVLICKMDATANDVELEVNGYPTLFWLPKGSKQKPQLYNGGRGINDFIKYIAEHSTNELKGFDRNGKPKKTEL